MGLLYSKPLETAFNSFNFFYNLKCLSKWSPTAKTFPLFRLPFVACLEVFKTLDPIELFIFSQCSKRVANCVHCSGTKKWKLFVDTRRKLIEINNNYKLFITESPTKPEWEYDRRGKTFFLDYQKSENSKQELRKVLSQLQAAFRCPVTSFTYTDWSDNGQCWVSVLKHIVQHQIQPLESIDIAGTFNHEDFDWALQNVKVTGKIGIRIYTARFFRPDLMMFKSCKCIELYYSWLKINDLDVFMKGWKAGSLPNLQYMAIGSDLFHSDDHILGFKRDEMKQLGVRRRLKIDENLSTECTGGVDIQSDDGTEATMQLGSRSSDCKLLNTTFDSFNPFYYLYSPTKYRNCSTGWSPTAKNPSNKYSSAKNFPLCRLPLLALLEVFKSLDPIELFILSQSSKKVASCVHIVGSEKWKLSVEVGNKRININDSYRLIIIETPENPSWKYDRNLKTFFLEYQNSGESELELRKVLSQLQTAFRCPVTSFEYAGWSDTDQCWLSVFDYIIHNQTQRLDSFRLSGRFNKDDLERALQNARNIRKINIHLLGTLHFTTNFQPTCEQLTFRSECFLTISLDLMRLNSCKYIELALSSFTCHALDVFMKEWKTGSFPNLQYLLIKRCKLNWADTILGFRRFEMRQLGVRRRLVIDENLSVDCTGGVDIQANNGTKATMQMGRRSPDWFELFVWNN
ncbi:hypothetical protein CAEBREN_25426 [Caenorhabditis brenneri]|uniref:F-box domain-containing protein n=1 Tax=Caenorhabditis brenneri TaxID=135651 RepID=G0N2C6_CAEBE|nr:hypothetical protein CAEBREN_25426 [Caenorhabditis brenneri]